MEKQELLEQISVYLPYNVSGVCVYQSKAYKQELTLRNLAYILDNLDKLYFKLYLRSLSDFVYHPEKYQEIRDNVSDNEFENLRDDFVKSKCLNNLEFISYSTAVILIKNHFDIFGLIEKGYAVDVNEM